VLSVRRLLAGFTVFLLVFAAAAPAVAACAGWSISPRDRHACCAHLGELASGVSVTDCCAGSEHSSGPVDRDNQFSDSVRPVVPVMSVLLVPSPEAGASLVDRVPVQAPSPPKYILLGSFLI
jgi:hypothetical protein